MARFTVYYKFLSFNSSAVWIEAPDEEVSSGGGVGLNALSLEGSQNMQAGNYRVAEVDAARQLPLATRGAFGGGLFEAARPRRRGGAHGQYGQHSGQQPPRHPS